MGLIEFVSEEHVWLCMVADPASTNKLSMGGSHSLVVDSGAYVHVRPNSYATHATLVAMPEC